MAFDYAKLPHEHPRRYVPRTMEVRWEDLSGVFKELKSRPLSSRAELERWIADEDELNAVVYERKALVNVNFSRQTDDGESRKAYVDFVQDLEPKVKLASFELTQKYVSSPARRELPPAYSMSDKSRKNAAEIFREENVALEKEDAELVEKYQGFMGAMTVSYKGEEKTLQQADKFLEGTDRSVREEVWRFSTARLLGALKELDGIYTRMVKVRDTIGRNAGFGNYRDFVFRQKNRFDYTPEDCARFHEAVARHMVPLSREIDEERMRDLGVDELRPWDLSVDPQGRPPLAPFSSAEGLVDGCAKVFRKVDPQFSSYFDRMTALGLRDLESRKGKAPGGFQDEFTELRLPFIFMNAAQRDSDVRTLLHESGHSFHTLLMRDAGLPFYNSSQNLPAEFAEVASISMELVGGAHLAGAFYGPEDAKRSNKAEVGRIIKLFTWVATIDAFQHWVYANPGHSEGERAEKWSEIFKRFSGLESYEGLEEAMVYRLHRQLHVYVFPFYYIEYGIATLGALGIWFRYMKDPSGAISAYKRALSLGSSKPLPELFRTADLPWDLGSGAIESYARQLRSAWKSYS